MSNDLNRRASDKEIAREVGYASNQVLVRVVVNHRHMSPSDFRETPQ